jgi:hypothetical protein
LKQLGINITLDFIKYNVNHDIPLDDIEPDYIDENELEEVEKKMEKGD